MTFAFWLSIISLFICIGDYFGNGLANIFLIRLNPLLDSIVFMEPFKSWILHGDQATWVTDSALIRVRFPAYFIHFGSFLLPGLILDYLIRFVNASRDD